MVLNRKKVEKTYKLENGIFWKAVKKSKHFLRVPEAIGIDKILFDNYEPNINYIQVFEDEDCLWYTISKEDFLKNCWRNDRGFGEQYFVALRDWEKAKTREIREKVSLFGG